MSVSTAYGGGVWAPRLASMRDDMAYAWGDWGVSW